MYIPVQYEIELTVRTILSSVEQLIEELVEQAERLEGEGAGEGDGGAAGGNGNGEAGMPLDATVSKTMTVS